MSKAELEPKKPVEATEQKQDASEDLSSLSASFEFSSLSGQKLSFSSAQQDSDKKNTLSNNSPKPLDFSLQKAGKLSFSTKAEEQKENGQKKSKLSKIFSLPDLSSLKRPVKPLLGFLNIGKESESKASESRDLSGFLLIDDDTLDSPSPILPLEDELSYQLAPEEKSSTYFAPADDPSARSFYNTGTSFYSLDQSTNPALNRLDQHSEAPDLVTEKVMKSTVSMEVADKIRTITAGGPISDWVEVALNEFHRSSIDNERISSELDDFNPDLAESKKDTEIA